MLHCVTNISILFVVLLHILIYHCRARNKFKNVRQTVTMALYARMLGEMERLGDEFDKARFFLANRLPVNYKFPKETHQSVNSLKRRRV